MKKTVKMQVSKGVKILTKELYNGIESFTKENNIKYENSILDVKDKEKAIQYITEKIDNDEVFWEHFREGFFWFYLEKYLEEENK